MAPRVTRLAGEARNAMVAATSSTLGQSSNLALGMAARLAGVSMIEGATALTRMPSPATSSASAWVSAPAAAPHGAQRRRRAQLAGDQIGLDHRHQLALAGVRRLAHGEAAGEMDRGPERSLVIEPGDRRLVAEIGGTAQLHAAIVLERKALGLMRVDIRHAATRALRQQRRDHRPAERAGAAGDDHLAPLIIRRTRAIIDHAPPS